jgi:hypothetical protein
LGVNIDQSLLGQGPPVFRIHGELRHLSVSLLPEECFIDSTTGTTISVAAALSKVKRDGNLNRRPTFELELDNIAYLNRQPGGSSSFSNRLHRSQHDPKRSSLYLKNVILTIFFSFVIVIEK